MMMKKLISTFAWAGSMAKYASGYKLLNISFTFINS